MNIPSVSMNMKILLLFYMAVAYTSACTCDMDDWVCIQNCKDRPLIITSNKKNQTSTDKNNIPFFFKKENQQPINHNTSNKEQSQTPPKNSLNAAASPQGLNIQAKDSGTKGTDLNKSDKPQQIINKPQQNINQGQNSTPSQQHNAIVQTLNANLKSNTESQTQQYSSQPENKPSASPQDGPNDSLVTKVESENTKDDHKNSFPQSKGEQGSQNQVDKAKQVPEKDSRREKIKQNLFSDPLLNSISDLLKPSSDIESQKENLKNEHPEFERQSMDLSNPRPNTYQILTNIPMRPAVSDQRQNSFDDGRKSEMPVNILEQNVVPLSAQNYQKPDLVILPQPTQQSVQQRELETEIKSKIRDLLQELEINEQKSKNIAQCGLIVCDQDPLNYQVSQFKRQPVVQPVIQPVFRPPLYPRDDLDQPTATNSQLNRADTIDTEHEYLRRYYHPVPILNSQMSNHNEPVNVNGQIPTTNMNHLYHNHPASRNIQDENIKDLSSTSQDDLASFLKTDPCLFIKIFEEYSKGINFLSPKMKSKILEIKNDFMRQYRDELVSCKHSITETKTMNYTTTRGILDGIQEALGLDRGNGTNGNNRSRLFNDPNRSNSMKPFKIDEDPDYRGGDLIYDTFENEQVLKERTEQGKGNERYIPGPFIDHEKQVSTDVDQDQPQDIWYNNNKQEKRPFIIKTVYLDQKDASDLNEHHTIMKTVTFTFSEESKSRKEHDENESARSKHENISSQSLISLSVIEKTVTVTETVRTQPKNRSDIEIENVPQTVKRSDINHEEHNDDREKSKKASEKQKKAKIDKKENDDTGMKDFLGILKQLEDVQPAEEHESTPKSVLPSLITQSSEKPENFSTIQPPIITISLEQSNSQNSQDMLSSFQIQSFNQSIPPQTIASFEKLNDIYSILIDMKEKIKTIDEKGTHQSQNLPATTSQPKIIDQVDKTPDTKHQSEITLSNKDISDSHQEGHSIIIPLTQDDSSSGQMAPPIITSSAIVSSPSPSSISTDFHSLVSQAALHAGADSQIVTVTQTIEVEQPTSEKDLVKSAQIVDKSVTQNEIIQEIRNDQKDMIGQLQKIIHKEEKPRELETTDMPSKPKHENLSGPPAIPKHPPHPENKQGMIEKEGKDSNSIQQKSIRNKSNRNKQDKLQKEQNNVDDLAFKSDLSFKNPSYELEKTENSTNNLKNGDLDTVDHSHSHHTPPSNKSVTAPDDPQSSPENQYQDENHSDRSKNTLRTENVVVKLPKNDVGKIKKKIDDEVNEPEDLSKQAIDKKQTPDPPNTSEETKTIAKLTVYPKDNGNKEDSKSKTELDKVPEERIKIEITDPIKEN